MHRLLGIWSRARPRNSPLTTEEKIQVWEWSAQYAASDKILIAVMESVRETVRLTNRAAELGYKAGLILAPHYYSSIMSRMETQTYSSARWPIRRRSPSCCTTSHK